MLNTAGSLGVTPTRKPAVRRGAGRCERAERHDAPTEREPDNAGGRLSDDTTPAARSRVPPNPVQLTLERRPHPGGCCRHNLRHICGRLGSASAYIIWTSLTTISLSLSMFNE